jgi:NADH:ubiquinone oxidoreductase subunit K
MMPGAVVLLLLGLFLFFAGILQCLSSKRFLGYLIGIEMIMNAANLNLAGFILMQAQRSELQAYIIMITALAVIEAAVGLSIFVWISSKEEDSSFSLL